MDNNKELAAALAHEVKNPVSLIKANIDYIQTQFPQAVRKNFNIINRELKKLDFIVSNYALFSDTSYDNNELIFIEDILNDITEEYDLTPLGKKITFTLDGSENTAIKGNYNKFCILFFNIIKNAVEAIDKEGIISCKYGRKDANAIIEIYNNGGCIPDEILKNLGKPYVTTKKGGNGLGLLICRSIVTEYNGNIIIENVNSGCKVTIILPAASDND